MWRVHCRVFGPSAEPRWFVVKDTSDGMVYLKNKNSRPLPFKSEQKADKAAADLNAEYIDIDARR